MKKHKITFNSLLILAIFFAVLHFVFLAISAPTVDLQSILLNLVPYGLPILLFACARSNCVNDKPCWSRSGFATMTLFALTFLAMSAHVTLAFFYSDNSFINIYFNVPIIYSLPLCFFSILWLGTKSSVKPQGEKGIIGKLISVLPKLLIVVMIIHTVIVSVTEIVRQSGDIPSTSAPWWVMPLVIAFGYVIAIAFALLVRGIYNRVKR